PSDAAFTTPLGEVPVDTAAIEALREEAVVTIDDEPHAPEHALEVELDRATARWVLASAGRGGGDSPTVDRRDAVGRQQRLVALRGLRVGAPARPAYGGCHRGS